MPILIGGFGNWALLFLRLWTEGFSGLNYVLPWGQISFWGATVITNLFSIFFKSVSNKDLTMANYLAYYSQVCYKISVFESNWRFYLWRSRNIWFLPHINLFRKFLEKIFDCSLSGKSLCLETPKISFLQIL